MGRLTEKDVCGHWRLKGLPWKNLYEGTPCEFQSSEIRKDGWIPVEERMPEDGTYLCTFTGDLIGQEEPFTGMCGIENGIWDEPDCVIAWQPLPEPYEGV